MLKKFVLGCVALGCAVSYAAMDPKVESSIKKKLRDRVPGFPEIQEVQPTPIKGIFEVRIQGANILYTDSSGSHLIEGTIYATKDRLNLTQKRIEELTKIPFKDLPFQNSFQLVFGSGERKMAVFEDPNCGYCKKFAQEVPKLKDVTVNVFLYPVLGEDSLNKAKAIWCSKDKAAAYTNWMIKGVEAAKAPDSCDASAIDKNVAFGKERNITGTPTMFFSDGTRLPGALPLDEVDKRLSQAASTR